MARDQLRKYRNVMFTCKCQIRSFEKHKNIFIYTEFKSIQDIFWENVLWKRSKKNLALFQENCNLYQTDKTFHMYKFNRSEFLDPWFPCRWNI